MVPLKILAIIICALIAHQDFRERAVTWPLFPLLSLSLLALYALNAQWYQFLMFATINFLIVSGILLVLYLYSEHVMKRKFLDVSFGLGDMFFFYALALGFPTLSFIILFVGALLFSLLVTLIFRKRDKMGTVPLAGLMGVFLIGVLLISFSPIAPSLHTF